MATLTVKLACYALCLASVFLISACKFNAPVEKTQVVQTIDDPESGADPVEDDTSEPQAFAVDRDKITFSKVIDRQSAITGAVGAVAGYGTYTASLSLVRDGEEMIAADKQDVTDYCGWDGSFALYLNYIAPGDVVTLHFVPDDAASQQNKDSAAVDDDDGAVVLSAVLSDESDVTAHDPE